MPYKVRDARLPGHFWADNALYDQYAEQIGVYAFAVYLALARYTNAEGKCFPSQGEIAKKLGIGVSTVIRALHTLETNELIVVEHRAGPDGFPSRSNIYTLLQPRNIEGEGMSDRQRGVYPTDTPRMSHRQTEQYPMNKTHLKESQNPQETKPNSTIPNPEPGDSTIPQQQSESLPPGSGVPPSGVDRLRWLEAKTAARRAALKGGRHES